MWWVTGLVCNAVIAVAYLLISYEVHQGLAMRAAYDWQMASWDVVTAAVLQGLVVAKLALELDQRGRALAALEGSIAAASSITTNLLGPRAAAKDGRALLRSEPAVLRDAI